MPSYSIREMTGFEIQTGNIHNPPKRASNNVKVLTAEGHTNRPSVKRDVKEVITILMTKKPPKEGQGTGPPSHLNKIFKFKIHYLLAFEFEVLFGNKI